VTYGMALCAGGGGLELGLSLVLGSDYRCVCYVEREAYAAATLAARMEEGRLAPAPVWDDLAAFDPEPWRGRVDILSGGFPCQPFSVAGQQRGVDDERNLWPAVARIIRGLGVPTVFLENVPGILRYYWDIIRPELREMGYEVAEGLFTASETGAPHKRERLFILADAGESGIWDQARTPGGGTGFEDVRQGDGKAGTVRPSSTGPELAHAASGRTRGQARLGERGEGRTGFDQRDNELADAERWPTERLAHNLAPTPRRAQGEVGEQRLRPDTGDGGNELADAEPAGLEGGTRSRADREGGASGQLTARDNELAGLPVYPPGPNDRDGWAYVLSVMPQAQPTFCRVDDGMAERMVADRLAMLGNGVAPLAAAYAYRTLAAGLKEQS